MHKPIKYAEKALTVAAGAAWTVFDKLNQIRQNPSFTPKWSDKPLLKSYQKTKPPLGWPRETDSLCPRCIPEIRKEILDGKQDYKILLNQKVGEIKAKVIERDGKILMVKDCPVHGTSKRDGHRPAFFAPGRCISAATSGSQRREAAQSRIEHHQARAPDRC
jgi:hypothetical protein